MTSSICLTIATSAGDVPLIATERGSGRPVVILHGGAGPVSVASFADLLAEATGTRVIVPTHPGFGGTPRPEPLSSIPGLAEVYAGLMEELDLEDVTVIGNSIGGWIASELALRHPDRLGRIALVDSVGIEVQGHPVAAAIPPAQLAQHSWYDPRAFAAAIPRARFELMLKTGHVPQMETPDVLLDALREFIAA